MFEFRPVVSDDISLTESGDSKVISNIDLLSAKLSTETNSNIFSDFYSDCYSDANICTDCSKVNKLQSIATSNISQSFNSNENDMSNSLNFDYYEQIHCNKCAKEIVAFKVEHPSVRWRSNEQLFATPTEKTRPILIKSMYSNFC